MLLVHDFAYAELGFDGYEPPSLLQVPGAKDVAVEIYSLTKSFSMAGWRVGFMLGNPEVVAALARLKSYLDYGTFQPIQIASIVAMNEAPEYPARSTRSTSAAATRSWTVSPASDGTSRSPRGRCSSGRRCRRPTRSSAASSSPRCWCKDAKVAVSPGVGFGPGGEGFVRFALVENEQRIGQALRGIRKALVKLG